MKNFGDVPKCLLKRAENISRLKNRICERCLLSEDIAFRAAYVRVLNQACLIFFQRDAEFVFEFHSEICVTDF